MNNHIYRTTAFLLMLSMPLFAGSRHEVLRGALVGAATGALLSEVSSGVHARTAIPLFAGLGALTGYSMYHTRNAEYYDAPDWWYDSNPTYYRYTPARHYRQRWNRSLRSSPQPVRTTSNKPTSNSTQPSKQNLYPGVQLIPIQIALPSGFPLTIHITHTGNQWVGPRGETYTNMPNAQQLQQTYTP